jgi:hypothetical protein
LWFDAALGHVNHLSVKSTSKSAVQGLAKSAAKADAKTAKVWTSRQGFDGTFSLKLNNVSSAPNS